MTEQEREDAIAVLIADFYQYAALNLKIKTKEGEIHPFEFNDPQHYIHEQLELQLSTTGKIRALLLKGRQQGASTYTEGRFYWRTSTNFGKQAYILTHEQSATDNLFTMAKRYHDNCCEELKPSTSAANAKELVFNTLDSGYKVGTAGSKAVGRSGTIQFFHGCLAAGNSIIDGRTGGLKPIEQFSIGDTVRTHTGKLATISFISDQFKNCLSFTLRSLGKFPLVATKEHRFWTKNGWSELSDLKPGDAIGFPVASISSNVTCLALPPATVRQQKGGRKYLTPDTINVDYDLGVITGLYLAEGHIKLQSKEPKLPSGVSFTIHRKEVEHTKDWLAPFSEYYSSLNVVNREESLTSVVTVYGSRFASLLNDLCGRTDDKHIPYDWMNMSESFCKGLLHGYISGDGSSYSCDRRVRATSIRSEITIPLRDMAAALGYGWAAIEYKTKAVRSGRNEKEGYTFSLCGDGATRLAHEIGKPSILIKNKKTLSSKGNSALTTEISNGYAWLRIRKIENAGVKRVFDFEVDHCDHSYCSIHGASHNSEVAFWPNAHEHFAGVVQCVPDAPGTEIILESTANGVGGKFHEMWQQAVNGESDYIAIFVPWFWSQEYRKDATGLVPTKKERLMQKLYGVDAEQLAWRRAKVKEIGQALCDQEYPYCWQDAFLASGRTVFDKDAMALALMETFKPKCRMVLEKDKFVERDNGELRVWTKPKTGFRYVIGCDVAEGLEGGDYSCADVLEMPSGTQVAQWHGHTAPDILAKILVALGKWYNKAMIAVESNNHGFTTNICLRDTGYSNIYVQTALDDRGSSDKETRRLGFQTTRKSKKFIIDNLSALLRDGDHGICCKETIQECQTYVVLPDGSYGGQSGTNDDRVMSIAIANYLATQSPGYKK